MRPVQSHCHSPHLESQALEHVGLWETYGVPIKQRMKYKLIFPGVKSRTIYLKTAYRSYFSFSLLGLVCKDLNLHSSEFLENDTKMCQKLLKHSSDLISFSFSFSSRWNRSTRKGPYALRPVSQQSPQGCPRNSVNMSGLNTDRSRPWRVECRPLPFSTPLSFRRSVL